MSLAVRAAISLLAGIGAGTVGFGVVSKVLVGPPLDTPEPGYTPWLLTGIVPPGLAVTGLVFHRPSRASRCLATATA